nr:hypothetical protein [Tanacetum cinerariifolium]
MPGYNLIVRAFASLGHDLGNSYVYDPNPNSFDCPPDSYHPPHPTYETYSYDSYGNDSQFGYDCQPQFPLHYESEQSYNKNYNSYPYDSSSLPQHYLCCARYGGPHETCHCDQLIFDEPYFSRHSSTSSRIKYPRDGGSEAAIFDELKHLSNLKYRDKVKIAELTKIQCSEVMKIVIPEVGGIDDDILLTIKDDILREKLLNVNLLISKIEALNANPTLSSDYKTKSSSTSPNSLLEETNTFDNSLPEFETFCFDVEPNSRDFTKDVMENISPMKEP